MYPENVALSFTSEILWPQSEFDGSGTRPGAGFVGCMHTQSLYLMLHHYLTSNKKIDCCATDSDLSLFYLGHSVQTKKCKIWKKARRNIQTIHNFPRLFKILHQ